MIHVTINGIPVEVEKGTTILNAAEQIGVKIPTLCYLKGLLQDGSCRIGTKRMLEILERIVAGEGPMEDLDKLEETAQFVKERSLCGLGKSAPLPVLSTLKYFREEYLEHIRQHKCRAHVCTALRQYVIDPDKCRGCTKCARNCPVGAISGSVKQPHVIDPAKCIRCGACVENCAFDAIRVE